MITPDPSEVVDSSLLPGQQQMLNPFFDAAAARPAEYFGRSTVPVGGAVMWQLPSRPQNVPWRQVPFDCTADSTGGGLQADLPYSAAQSPLSAQTTISSAIDDGTSWSR